MIYINERGLSLKNTAVTIGNFDGIHIGHQALINKLIQKGDGHNLNTVVLSFSPHPVQLITSTKFLNLFTSEEKKHFFSEYDIDYFIEYPFVDEFRNLSPEDFFKTVLVEKLGCKNLVIGQDYEFGSNKSGDVGTLKTLCEKYGIILDVVPHVENNNAKISSSTIRELILANDFDTAKKFMGRPYLIMGTVAEGRKIGRTLGFPTVNLLQHENKIIPKDGIFITKTKYKSNIYNSVTNIGRNPTVSDDTDRRTIETYIFEFEKQIYDEEITVYFYQKTRNEKKFNNVDELKNQISIDVSMAREYFSNDSKGILN